MDPYLEGYLWPDVHSALANKIRQLLAPQIEPNYVVRLEISVIEDVTPEAEIGIMYPVVSVPLRAPDQDVALDLSAALDAVYDEAFYHLSIDYSQDPPPPPLPDEDAVWLNDKVRGA